MREIEQLDIFNMIEDDDNEKFKDKMLPLVIEVFNHFYPELKLAAVFIPNIKHTLDDPAYLVKVNDGYQYYAFYNWHHVFPRWEPCREIPNDLWIVLDKEVNRDER